MQTILERIIPDKSQSTDSKKNLLQAILTKVQDETKKTAFIKEAINYLLSLEDSAERLQLLNYLVTYIQNNRYDCYSLDEIKNIIENNDELAIIVLFTNLFIKISKDHTKVYQLKNAFLKHIKKDEAYWFTDIIRDFLIRKAAQEVAASSQPAGQVSNTAAVLPGFQYDKHYLQVNIAFDFFSENPTFAPPNFDIKEVFLKWSLTIKPKTDIEKKLQSRIIEHLLDICRNNYQFYITCFKFIIKPLRHTYTNADTFECHYSVYNFLEHTDPKVLDELMKPIMIGEPFWGANDWLKIFKNLVRMGLSDNVGVTFLAIAKGLENIKAYGVLIRVQEEIIPVIIRPLTVKGWQTSALDILNYFILQGPVNAGLLQKVLGKLFTTIKDICKGEISQFSSDLISFLYHIKLKYAQSSNAEEIEQEYNSFIKECQIDPIRIDTHRYSIVPWAAFDAQQKVSHPGDKPKYRGLVNLGNTCYMNSFVQALFMTKLFRYRVLSLVDSVQKMYKNSDQQQQQQQIQSQPQPPKENGEANTQPEKAERPNAVVNSHPERKKAVSLFQLQKLFALMTSSERDAITPNFLKASLPGHFKTSHHQEDSSEFGRIYLDDLEKSLVNTEERDLVKELFTGEVVSYITCQDCGSKYKKVENFMDLSLNFESRDPNISYELPDLIHKNFEAIEFKDKNQYFCENCQKLSSLAIKTHIPTKIPPILILTINRFYFDTQTFQRVKILSHVNILEELDMTQEKDGGISEEIKYDLYAIVVHRGMTLDYGHYYSTAKEEVNTPVWVLFDDSNAMSLEKIDPFEYVKNNKQDSPYILFYQAREYFNKYSDQYKDFKLSPTLKRLVEQDNMGHLKEIDNNAKLLASITALNVPQNIMTGPGYNNYKKDDDDDNDYSKPNDFPGGNNFIM